MAVANLLPFALGAMAPAIVADLHLSRSRLGLLVSSYYLASAGLSLVAGRVVDRIGSRSGVAALVAGGAAAFVVVGVAHSYWILLGGAMLGAIAAGIANPATNLALTVVPGRRGVLVGVKQSGVQVGAVVAGAALPALAIDRGWRVAVLCSAVLFVPCLAGLRVMPGQPGRQPDARAAAAAAGAGLRGLPLYALLMGAGMATLTTYLPLYANQSVGMPARLAGLLLAVVGFFGVAARILWSAAAERPGAGRTHGVLMAMGVLAVCSAGLLVLAGVTTPLVLWLAAALAGSTAVAWNGVAMGAVVRFAAPARTALVSGQVQAAFFLGLCVGPPVFGALVDASGHYAAGWAWSALCFGGAAAVLSPIKFTRPALDDVSTK
jgi:MFS family permease